MVEEQYNEPSYLCNSDSRSVRKKAEEISGSDNNEEVARELFEWVRDRYAWDFTKIFGAESLLDRDPDRAMSFSKSNLLVAMLRSQDIPARFNLIECTFYNEYKDRVDDSIHAPVEVYLDGEWVTADPAFGEATKKFKSVSSFGEGTWDEMTSSRKIAELPRKFVWSYNYLLKFVHPQIRKLRKELRECQEI